MVKLLKQAVMNVLNLILNFQALWDEGIHEIRYCKPNLISHDFIFRFNGDKLVCDEDADYLENKIPGTLVDWFVTVRLLQTS